jgi:hypothetical protein
LDEIFKITAGIYKLGPPKEYRLQVQNTVRNVIIQSIGDKHVERMRGN